MTIPMRLVAPLGLLLAVAGCGGPAAEYTDAESPKNLTLATASNVLDLHFAAGSNRLLPGDSERLRRAAATGALIPADRVSVSVGGARPVAEARAAAISDELLRYGIVPDVSADPGLRPNHARLAIDRTLVTLPPCPNWSKSPAVDFTNMVGSNFGCSTASNLGLMVANPMDLAAGRPAGPADSQTAVAAVRRYYTDKVTLPAAANVGPIAAGASAPVGGSGGAPAPTPGSQ